MKKYRIIFDQDLIYQISENDESVTISSNSIIIETLENAKQMILSIYPNCDVSQIDNLVN